MNLEFKSKYCTFCLNKKFDRNKGLTCGLVSKPIIEDDTCSNYTPNQKLIERSNYNEQLIKKEETFKSRISNIKKVILIGVALFCIGYLSFNWLILESDYRYTLAKVNVTHQSGSDKFLMFGGYRCEFEYVFNINGTKFYNKGSLGGSSRGRGLSEPIWPQKFLVKYSPNNPEMNKVLPKYDVTSISFEDIPPNGISPDSLGYFLND
ncbi:MAG: hypothetical protein RIC95_15450 [Vicingaceae bacterium]